VNLISDAVSISNTPDRRRWLILGVIGVIPDAIAVQLWERIGSSDPPAVAVRRGQTT